jgi:hypothetical protein
MGFKHWPLDYGWAHLPDVSAMVPEKNIERGFFA